LKIDQEQKGACDGANKRFYAGVYVTKQKIRKTNYSNPRRAKNVGQHGQHFRPRPEFPLLSRQSAYICPANNDLIEKRVCA
jgi:hypothetical protein